MTLFLILLYIVVYFYLQYITIDYKSLHEIKINTIIWTYNANNFITLVLDCSKYQLGVRKTFFVSGFFTFLRYLEKIRLFNRSRHLRWYAVIAKRNQRPNGWKCYARKRNMNNKTRWDVCVYTRNVQRRAKFNIKLTC